MNGRPIRLVVAALAAAGLVSLAGCDLSNLTTNDPTPSATSAAAGNAPTAVPTASTSATADDTSGNDLPDPCTLLSEGDVTGLTGKSVTQVDHDDNATGTRHCQWQLSGGDLAVFLSRTTSDEFKVRAPDATDVDGVGDEAYTSSGHLFVRSGKFQIDVYATSGDSDAANLTVAKNTVEKIIPQL